MPRKKQSQKWENFVITNTVANRLLYIDCCLYNLFTKMNLPSIKATKTLSSTIPPSPFLSLETEKKNPTIVLKDYSYEQIPMHASIQVSCIGCHIHISSLSPDLSYLYNSCVKSAWSPICNDCMKKSSINTTKKRKNESP